MTAILALLLALLGLALTMGQSNASPSGQSQESEEWDRILDECHVPGAFPPEPEPEARAVPYELDQHVESAEIDAKTEEGDC